MSPHQPSINRRALMAGAASAGAAALLPAASTTAHAASVSAKERQRMVALLQAFMERYDVPGMSLCMARGGRIEFSEGLGLASREDRLAAAPESLFRIASLTKPITSVAVLTLAERGRLNTSDRVFGEGAILGPDFSLRNKDRFTQEVTVDHLLTHTTGGWTNDGDDPMFTPNGLDAHDLIQATLSSRPLEQRPGRKYAYSNFGYCVLGRVIEKVSGQSYEAFVEEAVLRPSGANGLRIAGNTLAERAPGEARYYAQSDADPYGMNVSRMDSHGGWIASAPDLVRFLLHCDRFGSVPDLLQPATTKLMTTPTPAGRNYARGWQVNRYGNWWHTGELPGTTTLMVRTSGGFCWAALTNTHRPNSDMGLAMDDLIWKVSEQPRAWR